MCPENIGNLPGTRGSFARNTRVIFLERLGVYLWIANFLTVRAEASWEQKRFAGALTHDFAQR